jgi:Mn-dependent DtxR family transcriptional regulator
MQPLTRQESIVLAMIERAAFTGKPCPSNLDIEMELNCNSSSIAPTIIRRLEEKGYIKVTRYQRAREVTLTSTGMSTAPHPQRHSDRPHVPRGARSANSKRDEASERAP